MNLVFFGCFYWLNSILPKLWLKKTSYQILVFYFLLVQRRIYGGARGASALPIFCSHFEVLQTVLFEVELIINNALLTYVYPNSLETCLTPNHLLFGRQLPYSSNTTSTVVRNLTVLSSTTDRINSISNQFWNKWTMNMY